MRKFFCYVVVIIVFVGFVLAIIESYKIRKDIRLGYQTVGNLVEITFLPFFFISFIFGGEFVFSKFFLEKDIKYFKHIIIFFLIQFLIGIVLLIPHFGYWIDYFRNYGNVQFMMSKHKVDFLTSSLYILDTQIGLCLTISSIVFFIQLYKKFR